jgi:hypothetical protein
MRRRIPWKPVLGVLAVLMLIVGSAVTAGWVVGLLASLAVVCSFAVVRQSRRSELGPAGANNGGRWVVCIAMVLAIFGGIFGAARASGDSGSSAAVQALLCACLGSAVVAWAVSRKARRP